MYIYKKIKLKDGNTIDQHRLIMETHLGRKLLRKEVVHHKDGNKLNNDIQNLELMSLSEHARLHQKENWQNPDFRKNQSEKMKQWHAKQPKNRYFSKVIGEQISNLARDAWPAFTGSIREYSRHYGIHHKQMLQLLKT